MHHVRERFLYKLILIGREFELLERIEGCLIIVVDELKYGHGKHTGIVWPI